jgi:hypothetical protein
MNDIERKSLPLTGRTKKYNVGLGFKRSSVPFPHVTSRDAILVTTMLTIKTENNVYISDDCVQISIAAWWHDLTFVL